jgi:hypothetical protein
MSVVMAALLLTRCSVVREPHAYVDHVRAMRIAITERILITATAGALIYFGGGNVSFRKGTLNQRSEESKMSDRRQLSRFEIYIKSLKKQPIYEALRSQQPCRKHTFFTKF